MRPLHIIMPMAGEGNRFKKEGWTVPKPLIHLNGQPLFKHAISSVRADDIHLKYSFVVRKEHIEEYQIAQTIKSYVPDANIFSVEKTTRGAVETCLMAESVIADSDAVIVMDCDLEFHSESFMKIIREMLQQPYSEATGGVLVSFDSDDPRYSYAALNEEGFVIRTAEKEVISNHALCGAYFFSNGKRFKQIAHQLLEEPVFTKPEYYISLLYNYLLADGETVRLSQLDEYYSYGTPEELKQYL